MKMDEYKNFQITAKREGSNINTPKSKSLTKIILAVALLMIIGVSSYAFFSLIGDNNKNQTLGLSAGTMSLRFADNDNGINATLRLGETVTKKFIIENTGSLESSLSLDFFNLQNTYLNKSLSYNLTYSEEENGEYTELIHETDMPVSRKPITSTISSEISVPAGETYYYNLNVTFNYLEDVNQDADINAEFSTQFSVNNPSKYRYYRLEVDPNGGLWNTFTGPQEYLMMNNDEMQIPDPTRLGHVFDGWKMIGNSSELEGNRFAMGITDTYLTAQWTLKKIKVTIDGEERMVDFGSAITLDVPERENYTFTGWTINGGGSIEGNVLTVVGEEDITITSNFKANSYKYIVYHNQMNVSGNGYSVVEADTVEGEALLGTTVTPDVNTYTGFTSPVPRSLTIQEETVYPPIDNRVDYNYERNKYKITTFLLDGTIEIGNMYYEESREMAVPTYPGYTFTHWTVNDVAIAGNTITMGTEDLVVRANHKPANFIVYFDPNGGTSGTTSKTVTFDTNYGSLPTPEYSGYQFEGWYTSKDGGVQVTENTKFTDPGDKVLYAHWKKLNTMMARDDNESFWELSSNITSLTFETTMSAKENAAYTSDLSSDKDGSIMAYLIQEPDNEYAYDAYIQANGVILAPEDSSALFANFSSLSTIEGLENLDVSNVTNMSGMFSGSSRLTSLDLSHFSTNSVTDMSWMFQSCSSLETLIVPFDTSSVTTMNSMFYGCNVLTSLDLSTFTTESVTDMSLMFNECSSLKTLDFRNLYIANSSVYTWDMFTLVNNLELFDLSNMRLPDSFSSPMDDCMYSEFDNMRYEFTFPSFYSQKIKVNEYSSVKDWILWSDVKNSAPDGAVSGGTCSGSYLAENFIY